MECLYRPDLDWIFNKNVTKPLTPTEQGYLINGFWERYDVPEGMESHMLADHCVIKNKMVYVLLESEWPENQEMYNGNS